GPSSPRAASAAVSRALPGGRGRLEGPPETLPGPRLGTHTKPVAALNPAGYWDSLIHLLAHAVGEGFVRREYAALLLVGDTPAEVLDRMYAWQPPALPRAWLSPSQA